MRKINQDHGYGYSCSSAALKRNGGAKPFVLVRDLNDFTSAKEYSEMLTQEFGSEFKEYFEAVFPISRANFQGCISENDFMPYVDFLRSEDN